MKRRVVSLLLVGVMAMGLVSGCGNKEEKPAEKDGEVVELDFYLSAGAINDQERIMEKANEIIEDEIGAHLNIISLADYNTMQLMIDTGDPWDLCFTSNWMGDYYGNAQKGAYADLTELLPELAPETYSRIPEGLWEGMKVDGKIYGSVNYQQYGSSKQLGFRFRKDIAEEVGFDWKSLKGMDTLEALNKIEKEYLAPAKAAHPDMIGWEAQAGSNLFPKDMGGAMQFWNMEGVGDDSIGVIDLDAPEKVINPYDTDAFMEYCKIMRRWYEAGYIPADASTVEDTSADRTAGKYLAEVSLEWPDSVDLPRDRGMSMTTLEQAPAVDVSTTDLLMPASAAPTAAVAVNAYSENIEKSVELIELLNTNDDLYNLICYGEEGVDFEYSESGVYTPIEGKYSFNWSDYQLGQSYDPEFNRSKAYNKGENGEIVKEGQAMVHEGDKTAPVSPLSGFVFDPTPVKTEIANVSAIKEEMLLSIVTGSVDPTTAIPEFLERLEGAGASKIIEEKQAQLDEWNASK